MCFKSLMSRFLAVHSSMMFNFQMKCNDGKSADCENMGRIYFKARGAVYFQGPEELRLNRK